jgi:superfamily II DNA or RNA helicase
MPDGNLVIVGSIQSLTSPKRMERKDISITSKQAIKKGRKWAESGKGLDFFPEPLENALYEDPSAVNKLTGKFLQLLKEHCISEEWSRIKKAQSTRAGHALEIQDHVKDCDMLLVDEADLAVGKQYSKLFKGHFTGRRKYGFSGTPFDKDKPVQNLMLRENLGGIISHVPRSEVQKVGRIIPVKFYMIGVGEDGDKTDSRAYDIAMKEEIIENQDFHQLVANIQGSFPDDGTLILVDTSPIGPLGVSLEELIPNSKFIYGGTPKPERRKFIKLFEERQLKCLIGSKILKRGLDLEGGVENLIIIGGGQKWSEFDQKVGRAVRINKKGWARVFGFFFLNNKYLYKHSRENLKAIVEMGYEAKVVVGGNEIDGKKLIKSRFRFPKNN